MKKLTAGIFATLLTVVGVSGANAEIASKAYVDQGLATKASTTSVTNLTTEVTTFKEGINTTITNQIKANLDSETSDISKALDAKADKATTLAGYGIGDAYTKKEVDTALGNKQNTLTAGTGIKIEGNTIRTDGIATNENLTTLEGKVDDNTAAIETLNGTGATSVTGKITTALTPYQTAEQAAAAYDAKGAAADAETAAKAYADGLAGNYATAAQGALATTAVQTTTFTTFQTSNTAAIADAKKAGTDAAAALDEYKESNDGVIAGINSKLENVATTEGLSDLTDKVTANTDAIEGMNLTEVTGVIKSISQTDGKVTATAGEITNADVAANAAIAASKIAGLSALATATIPTACETGAAECVLKLKDGVYTWETIALTYSE